MELHVEENHCQYQCYIHEYGQSLALDLNIWNREWQARHQRTAKQFEVRSITRLLHVSHDVTRKFSRKKENLPETHIFCNAKASEVNLFASSQV